MEYHRDLQRALITVSGKPDFSTPFALRCCVIWAFPTLSERTPIEAATLT
jgi:hypothetical protein